MQVHQPYGNLLRHRWRGQREPVACRAEHTQAAAAAASCKLMLVDISGRGWLRQALAACTQVYQPLSVLLHLPGCDLHEVMVCKEQAASRKL